MKNAAIIALALLSTFVITLGLCECSARADAPPQPERMEEVDRAHLEIAELRAAELRRLFVELEERRAAILRKYKVESEMGDGVELMTGVIRRAPRKTEKGKAK